MGQSEYVKHQVSTEQGADGSILLQSTLPIGPVVQSTTLWLQRWAAEVPTRTFLKERSGPGWRSISYGETLEQVQAMACSLLEQGIGPGSPIVVLSGPGIDHAILMLAAQYIGAPIAPLAEQYSLIPEASERLDYCVNKIQPKLVYAADGERYANALNRESLASTVRLVSVNASKATLKFEQLLSESTLPSAKLYDAAEQVNPSTLAKILFTSGSTGNPKGVPQTQRMLTVNQAQYLACLPMLGARPPVMVDWLPWNHVFAGNSNFYLILSNGGTLIIDDGKPAKGLFDRTLENLSMHVGTLSFNVPIAYSLLVDAFNKDKNLKERFFADLDMVFYAGASLPADLWNALEKMSMDVSGKLPMMTSSWGLTETAPCSLIHHQGGASSGMIGVPVPELDVKLIPYDGDRYEIRVKGPNVITSYFDAPEIDASAFDDDGYFITNDAIKFVDQQNPAHGVRFDGRISEDFKLLTGTWVQAADIRLRALSLLEELVQDVVVTGADRRDIGLLVFPSAAMALDSTGDVISDDEYSQKILERLMKVNQNVTGSSKRIARVLIMATPPSVTDAEITAKGSLNINAVLSSRLNLLERLYDDADSGCLKVGNHH